MKDWKNSLVPATSTIKNAIEIIDKSALQIGLVVDENQKLLGTVTDGDIRRGIIRAVELESPVTQIMSTSPIVAKVDESREEVISYMKRYSIRHIPILDHDRRVVGLTILQSLLQPDRIDNPVVLMAGGLGTRLRPLTEDCPKPMLKIGDKPLLETTIDRFIEYGFHHFYICVNYKADKIKSFFGDGDDRGVNIHYIHETKPLGTAGALSLLPDLPEMPFIVMNADLLTKVDFKHLLDFHSTHNASATMCIRTYDFQVPYGVVNVNDHHITGIDEKPVHSFFVNAGIYVLNKSVIKHIPPDTTFDMPDLFDTIMKDEITVAFPIREYWMDIGQIDDFQQADGDFHDVFSAEAER